MMKHPLPVSLATERLQLTSVKPEDLQEIHVLHSLPETDEFNALGIPKDLEETRAVLQTWLEAASREQQSDYIFSICKKPSHTFMGLIALKCGNPKYRKGELWYKLHKDYWGKGYATEAVERLLAFAFSDLHLHRVEAGCAVANIGSIRVLEKVGMQQEGRKRKVLPLKTGWSDNYEFAILEEDWVNKQPN